MEDYTLAVNTDTRAEAFYIGSDGIVMHTWQLAAGNKTAWTSPNPLTGDTGTQLANAVRVESSYGSSGIQVVAYTKDGKYYICYQTPGQWLGWYQITQS